MLQDHQHVLQNCTGERNQLKNDFIDFGANLTHHTDEWPRWHDPNTITKRDVYVASATASATVFLFTGILFIRNYIVRNSDNKLAIPKKGRTDSDTVKKSLEAMSSKIDKVQEAATTAMEAALQANQKADRAIEASVGGPRSLLEGSGTSRMNVVRDSDQLGKLLLRSSYINIRKVT